MYKILIADNVAKEGIEILEKYKDINVDVKTGLSADELAEIIGEYDGLVVRSASKFKGDVIQKAIKMKVVGRAGAGVDNIDVEESSKKGIIVMNTPGGNSSAVAELTIALMLALSRNIYSAVKSMKDGKWEKKSLAKTCVEIGGKTLGLLGAGNIGSLVANKALGLKMNVIVYDPFLTDEKASILGITKVNNIEDIYKNSDYISLHLPKNEQTINIINKNSISKMKDGVFLINCARGGIINEDDLLEALNSGKIKACALDVYKEEPVAANNPIVMHDNVICTPHLGASSAEAQINVAVAIANQVGDYLTKGEIKNAINAPSLDAKTREIIGPYITLARKIGSLYSQFSDPNIKEINVNFEGEVCSLPTNPINISLLIGLLSNNYEGINFVNAGLIAKENGLKITVTNNPESLDYASQITLNVKNNTGTSTIKGAVFKEGIIRIVEIDGFTLDFEPEGNLLLALNNDKPGFIGQIGTVIGNAGLNISNMELGRNKTMGKALSFIQIDGEISDSLIEEISKITTLEKVYKIKI